MKWISRQKTHPGTQEHILCLTPGLTLICLTRRTSLNSRVDYDAKLVQKHGGGRETVLWSTMCRTEDCTKTRKDICEIVLSEAIDGLISACAEKNNAIRALTEAKTAMGTKHSSHTKQDAKQPAKELPPHIYDENFNPIYEGDKVEIAGMTGTVVTEYGALGIGFASPIDWERLNTMVTNGPLHACLNDNFISFWELAWNLGVENDNIPHVKKLN